MEVVHLTQTHLAKRWSVSEGTLERWRSDGIGPIFLKLKGQVRYRIRYVEQYEKSCLSSSTRRIICLALKI